jgi:hypothetical protein
MTRSAIAATVGFVLGFFVVVSASFQLSALPAAEAGNSKCEKACQDSYRQCRQKNTSPADCAAAKKACDKACK